MITERDDIVYPIIFDAVLTLYFLFCCLEICNVIESELVCLPDGGAFVPQRKRKIVHKK